MDDIKQAKARIRNEIIEALESLPESEIETKTQIMETRLFDFANFYEAKILLMFIDRPYDIKTQAIIRQCRSFHKIIVLPAFEPQKFKTRLYKVDNIDRDLQIGPRGCLEPNPSRCKEVPLECLDIAIIPGLAFDEKGARLGYGEGYYDRLLPRLPSTTRKVAVAFENKILQHVPMESHDRHVDIVLTEERTIFKI
ncbi:MAG: 5-formyltetrahydrofolate cyclo-ligase [Desulfatirhabdiaceae bacterium]